MLFDFFLCLTMDFIKEADQIRDYITKLSVPSWTLIECIMYKNHKYIKWSASQLITMATFLLNFS